MAFLAQGSIVNVGYSHWTKGSIVNVGHFKVMGIFELYKAAPTRAAGGRRGCANIARIPGAPPTLECTRRNTPRAGGLKIIPSVVRATR